MNLPQLLTIKEASKALKVHPNTLRLWEKEGLITSCKVNGKRFKRYKKEDLAKLLEGKDNQQEHQVDNSNKKMVRKDINRQKEIEKRLIEVEKYFKLIVDNSIDLIGILDINGNYMYVSPSHERVLGYTNKDLIGKSLNTIIHPEDMHALLEDKEKSLKGELATNLEFRIKHKNGSWIIAEGSAQAMLDKEGRPSLIVAKARDITARKQAEDAMSFLSKAGNIFSSSLDLRQTLQSITNLCAPYLADWCAIEMINENGEIEIVSLKHKDPEKIKFGQEFRKNFPFGFSEEIGTKKVISTGKSYLFIEKDRILFEKVMKEKGHANLAKELNFRSAMIVPLKVRSKVIGVMDFLSSNEDKKYTINDLVFVEELASRAALAIENSRLYAHAQQAVSIRDDFISMASHELKTPVTSLKIYTQILQKQFKGKDKAVYAQITKMDNQIKQMTKLITQLLDLSRMHAKKLVYHKKVFSVDNLIEEVVQTMQQTTGQTIVINGLIKKEIYADRDRIGQVLTNLLSNAIKYSQQANKIIVTPKVDKKWVMVSVQDFGIGISKAHQEKIFERFYQVTESIGKSFPGLGIGLYLSSEVIRIHGGKIWVTSKEGEGSTFSFSLPFESN